MVWCMVCGGEIRINYKVCRTPDKNCDVLLKFASINTILNYHLNLLQVSFNS